MTTPEAPDADDRDSPSPPPGAVPPSADLGPRLLAAVGWATFGLLAIDRVGEGPLTRLDEPLLRLLPHEGAIFTVSDLATHLGDAVVLVAIALLGTVILLHRRAFVDAGVLVFAKAASLTVVLGLKFLFGRARPAIATGDGLCCAFPSGHATDSAMLFVMLAVLLFERRARLRPWAEGVAIGLALVVGATRVILGVHWPTDVVAGWGLGFALAGTFLLLRAFLHRQKGSKLAAPVAEPQATPTPQEVHANAAPPMERALPMEGFGSLARARGPSREVTTAGGSRGCRRRRRRS